MKFGEFNPNNQEVVADGTEEIVQIKKTAEFDATRMSGVHAKAT